MNDRYFSPTILGQRLYVEGLGEYSDWNPNRLVFYSAGVVAILLKPNPRDRRVHTEDELRTVMRETTLSARKIFIHESLQDVVRRILKGKEPADSR